jgi:hypothetical protein
VIGLVRAVEAQRAGEVALEHPEPARHRDEVGEHSM